MPRLKSSAPSALTAADAIRETERQTETETERDRGRARARGREEERKRKRQRGRDSPAALPRPGTSQGTFSAPLPKGSSRSQRVAFAEAHRSLDVSSLSTSRRGPECESESESCSMLATRGDQADGATRTNNPESKQARRKRGRSSTATGGWTTRGGEARLYCTVPAQRGDRGYVAVGAVREGVLVPAAAVVSHEQRSFSSR